MTLIDRVMLFLHNPAVVDYLAQCCVFHEDEQFPISVLDDPHCMKYSLELSLIAWYVLVLAACLTWSVLLQQVIDAADEVIKSIDRDELAKYLSQKSVPEDEEEEVCLMLQLPISNMKLDCII